MSPVIRSLLKSFGIDPEHPEKFFASMGIDFEQLKSLPPTIARYLEEFKQQQETILRNQAEILSLLKKDDPNG